MTIKGIFFDASGVLYIRSGHTGDYALDLLREHGYQADISDQSLGHLEKLRQQANRGLADYITYWDQFLLLRGVVDLQQRKRMTGSIIDFSNNVQPAPNGHETLAELKKRGFVLGIITDTMYPLEWKKRRLERAGVAEFIDIIACSTSLGMHKPNPAIYQYAIRQLSLSPQETAFIGHLAVELDGARIAGMTTIAVNYDDDTQADYHCASLSDLLALPIFQAAAGDRT
jgi:HAD superfamily hydrolase (TIGR01509 family)